jgi:hypothetical protein
MKALTNMAQNKPQNDFKPDEYATKFENVEKFIDDFSGKNFDKKVCEAIKDAIGIQETIKEIVWKTIKDKIVWIILGAIGLLALQVIISLIPAITKKVMGI